MNNKATKATKNTTTKTWHVQCGFVDMLCSTNPEKHLHVCVQFEFKALFFHINRQYISKQISSEPAGQQSQLTHCWLGMATEVSTSAMAPNIWSVRPWFFCRAFILLNTTQKLYKLGLWFWCNLRVPCLSCALVFCPFTVHCAAVWSSFYHDTQETSCARIDQGGAGGGLVSVWEHALGQEPQHVQDAQVRWLQVSVQLPSLIVCTVLSGTWKTDRFFFFFSLLLRFL